MKNEARFRVAGRVSRDPKAGSGARGAYMFVAVEVMNGDKRTYVDVSLFEAVAEQARRAGIAKGKDVVIGGHISARKLDAPTTVWVPSLIADAVEVVRAGNSQEVQPAPMGDKAPTEGDDDVPF